MNPFRDALELHPRPSRQLARVTLGFHLTAAAVVLYTALLQAPVAAGLLMPISVSALWYLRRQRRTDDDDVVRLTCREDGSWRWQCVDGRIGFGTSGATSVSTALFVVLHLRGTERRTVLLPRDSLDGDEFRWLRARLRLAAGTRV